MNISQAAKASGLSAKAIRYYERVGLAPEPVRGGNGYREYSAADLETLSFIQRARSTGFSVEESRQLLSLYENTDRHSAEVKTLVEEKLQQVESQLEALVSMRNTLQTLVGACPGDEQSRCNIIDTLAEGREHV